MKFRVHHILCTSLYQGYGYSGPFCENMTKIINYLCQNPDEPLTLVTEPDAICANCPNLDPIDNGCSGDHNHVHIKDVELLNVLGLEEGAQYSYRQLLTEGIAKFTKEVFEKSCSNCAWYHQGLCNHEDFIAGAKRML
ncbi:MAG: DUF1284 domain-containing protein [Lachnospiraceae bacterium]|nr:DUF1284 domain-containing protein [Lachnospiraceae bacterium]